MDIIDFLIHWLPVAICGILIYIFVQKWFCHPSKEKGLHLRGMFLKYACWPVFLLGFVLSLWDGKIPYIPTAKQAVKGFTPFVRPLIIQQFIFWVTIIIVVIQRKYFTAEARLALTAGEIWGMVAFAMIAYLMTWGGIYAAIKSRKISIEEPWSNINIAAIDHIK
jgi:cellulose synthase (UDP-forming)